MKKNTFVAGIHAVGKSFLCAPAAESGKWIHSSASALIKLELGRANWSGDKRVANTDLNQKALVAAVRRINADGNRLLLDGHFVLRDASDDFVYLGADVFADLNLSNVVLIVAPPDVIRERLQKRDGVERTERDIQAFQDAERAQAESVCTALGLRLTVMTTPTAEQFLDVLEL